MRFVLSSFAAVSVLALVITVSVADEKKETKPVTGILIDQACAAGMMSKDDPEAAAAGHPKSCAMKESCAKSGYCLIVGKMLLKFDPKGNLLARDFLARSPKDKDLRVTVLGIHDDHEFMVEAIAAAPDK